MHRGYIKLWRKARFGGLLKDHKTWALWCLLLMMASHKETTMIINGRKVDLKPGELVTGREALAKELGLSPQNIRTCLRRLEKYGNLTTKSTNKYSLISITNWETYQDDLKQINQQTNQHLTSNQPASNQHYYKQECKTLKECKETYNDRFLRFWKSYPKKVAKGAAWRAWKKINPDKKLFDEILNAVSIQKKSDQWKKDNGQFIPHPSTWLNQRRWEDEISSAPFDDFYKDLSKHGS